MKKDGCARKGTAVFFSLSKEPFAKKGPRLF
mgnify:FL=1